MSRNAFGVFKRGIDERAPKPIFSSCRTLKLPFKLLNKPQFFTLFGKLKVHQSGDNDQV